MDVSVVIPCLNEAATVGKIVAGARSALESMGGVSFEIIVADNGSSDNSKTIAEGAGAIVLDASETAGVGAATRFGARHAKGELVVFLDADEEHDPAEIPSLLKPLVESDARIVLGSRYRGKFMKGASSTLARVVGTPALTGLLNHYFQTNITDCNTGFRALRREVLEELDCRSDGFEFCSEMIVRAGLLSIPIVEVPIVQHPGPEGRTPHLRRFRDGWRHLKFILLHAPDRVLLRPGFAALIVGALLFFPQIGGRLEIGAFVMDIHLMILGALLLNIGVEMVGSAILCATIAGDPVAPLGHLSRRLGARFTLDRVLPVAGVLFFSGFVGDVLLVFLSAQQGFSLERAHPRLALVGTVGMGIAVQLFVLSFVHSVIEQHSRQRPPPSQG